jgi:hypothetical protein
MPISKPIAMYSLFFLFGILPLSMSEAFAQQRPGPGEVAQDLRELQYMYEGAFVRTPFPGIYRMVRSTRYSPRITAPILMTRNAEFTFNNGKLGPQHGDTGRALTLAEWGALVMRWRQSLRLDQFLHFGGDGPLRMIVVSGFDCPYSKKLEAALKAKAARYAVAPSTIGTANQPYLRDIWCSADRSVAWTRAMTGALPPRAPASCDYDADYFQTFNGMMGGLLPNVLYADGTIGSGSDSSRVLAKLQELQARDIRF